MKILDLSLTYHWYDEIESGRKKEEYRDIKPFYRKRIMDCFNKYWYPCPNINCTECKYRKGINAPCKPIRYDAVRFHRGQGGKTTMLFKLEDIHIGYGRPNWGAPDNKKVFIIQLGDKIK